jgi:diacylglycerol kinase (ATP)
VSVEAPPKVVVIANPASGRGKAGRLIPAVRDIVGSLAQGSEVRISDGPDHATELARQAANDGVEVVAAMGGDGMVGMVGEALVGTSAALGVIPTGTGNDFARLLGIDRRRPAAAAAGLCDPSYVEIDAVHLSLGDGSERYFVNVAGAGFDSEVTETANRMRTRIQGTAKYVAAVFKTLPRFRAGRFEVDVDGTHHTLPGMMIAVGNGISYGGGMKITPRASFTDGLLDITVIGEMSKPEFVRNFPTVFRGTHLKHPKVTSLRASRVEISADRTFEVYADGERVGPLPATFEVIPAALRVVVPKRVPSHGR